MADVNRGNRPLSPHMSIYRPQVTSVFSIFHRITFVVRSARFDRLALGAVVPFLQWNPTPDLGRRSRNGNR